jgi:hypothetical protein
MLSSESVARYIRADPLDIDTYGRAVRERHGNELRRVRDVELDGTRAEQGRAAVRAVRKAELARLGSEKRREQQSKTGSADDELRARIFDRKPLGPRYLVAAQYLEQRPALLRSNRKVHEPHLNDIGSGSVNVGRTPSG